MAEEKVNQDFEAAKKKADEIKAFLDNLYYNPELANMFNKPVIAMLINACDYLKVNLEQLKTKYNLT